MGLNNILLVFLHLSTCRRLNQRNKENVHEQRRRESRGRSQSQLALDSNGDVSGDLFYNSRPPESRRQTSTVRMPLYTYIIHKLSKAIYNWYLFLHVIIFNFKRYVDDPVAHPGLPLCAVKSRILLILYAHIKNISIPSLYLVVYNKNNIFIVLGCLNNI